MKTFVVLSDSHGRRGAIEKLRPLFAENDYIVHLGDGSGDVRGTSGEYPEKTYVLRGNCDFAYGEEECVIEAEGVRLFCCHGHRYGVKSGLQRLVARGSAGVRRRAVRAYAPCGNRNGFGRILYQSRFRRFVFCAELLLSGGARSENHADDRFACIKKSPVQGRFFRYLLFFNALRLRTAERMISKILIPIPERMYR